MSVSPLLKPYSEGQVIEKRAKWQKMRYLLPDQEIFNIQWKGRSLIAHAFGTSLFPNEGIRGEAFADLCKRHADFGFLLKS